MHFIFCFSSLFSLLLVSCLSQNVCSKSYRVTHKALNGPTHVHVTVWKLCHNATSNSLPPAAFVVNGALVLRNDYNRLAIALARRGFVVFSPEYSSRPPFSPQLRSILLQIRNETAGRWKCPRYGSFTSVSMFRTLTSFANKYADVQRALVFGHSQGAVVVAYELYRRCDFNRNDAMVQFICDGARANVKRNYHPVVVVLFESLGNLPNIEQPKDVLLVNMLSQFASNAFQVNASQVLRNRAIDVRFDSNVNHFGPNDFTPAFNHVKTKCAMLSGRGRNFRTSAVVQNAVVRAIADIATLAYYSYLSAGDSAISQIVNEIRTVRFVDNVKFII